MFLALRELKHSRLRYLLIGAIMALIAWLVFLLSGLANGLASDNGASIQNLKADYVVYQSDVRLFLHRSLLPAETVDQIKQIPGVNAAAPLGQLTVTTSKVGGGEQIDATILAIDPTGILAPQLSEGQSANSAVKNGVVVDEYFKRHSLKLGDQLQINPSGQLMTIVGFTKGQTYGHLPVIFSDIPFWQALRFAAPGSKGNIDNPISAVAVQMNQETAARVAKAIPGIEVATRDKALESLPGYKEEMGSIVMIMVFLFLIAAFIMAVFFYIMTLQKTNQFGILKALGASSRFLAIDLLGQVFIMTLAGLAIGVLLTYGVAAIMPAAVPFALDTGMVGIYAGVLLVVAMVGTLLSLWRIVKVDPLLAIGRVD
jgi:putative ABC transport system permease protein